MSKVREVKKSSSTRIALNLPKTKTSEEIDTYENKEYYFTNVYIVL